MNRTIVFALLLSFTACGTTLYTMDLNPVKIDFIEHRTFWSTTAVAIVHQGDQVVGVAPGTGKPIAAFAAELVGAAAVAASLVFIGTNLKTINTGTSHIQVDPTTLGQ